MDKDQPHPATDRQNFPQHSQTGKKTGGRGKSKPKPQKTHPRDFRGGTLQE